MQMKKNVITIMVICLTVFTVFSENAVGITAGGTGGQLISIYDDILEELGYPTNWGDPYHNTTMQEYSPVQTTGNQFPQNAKVPELNIPCDATYTCAFSGTPGYKASHEGVDFVHHDSSVENVMIKGAAYGIVVYVRTGCPQSCMFGHNTDLREAGAGWGNHVVVYHGTGVYTRYAHLRPDTVRVVPGDRVAPDTIIGEMGNSGRSELRHLHFELGYLEEGFYTDRPSQSFDLVFDPMDFIKD
ncbi:MAG: M23 family metallopeptidase [Candidatus Muiribacteriaceae bacterium]